MSFQNLVLNNVNLLGYTHTNQFFGEKSLHYGSVKTISLRGYVLDLANSYGVKNILQDVINIQKFAKSFQSITINNESYGQGKITTFSVDPGNWVRTTEYQITVEILTEVPLANLSTELQSVTGLGTKKLYLLKSFSENFSIDFDLQNKILGGEHSLDIEYNADNANIDLIKFAQSLAASLLKTLPTSVAAGNYTGKTRQNYTVLNNEFYDVINGKAGFRRTFSYSTENVNKNYSLNKIFSVQQNEQGIATVSADYEIKAEYNVPSLYDNSIIGLNDVKALNHFSILSNFFNNYKSKLFISVSNNLNTHPLSTETTVNKFNGTINYIISFDNDPKRINPNYRSEYSISIERGDNNIWSVTAKGSLQGIGKIGDLAKYANVENAWTNEVKNSIEAKILNYYNNEVEEKSGSPLKIFSYSISKSPYQGTINFNYTYNDDPTIIENDPNNIRRLKIQKSDTGLMPITVSYLIPNREYALLQNRSFKKQGMYSIDINMEIGCTDEEFNSKKYFDIIKSTYKNFESLTPGPKDSYLESISFSSDEIENTVQCKIEYKYS